MKKQIPKQVLKLAEKMQADGAEYLFRLNTFDVYEPIYISCPTIGRPKFILSNSEITRDSTNKEIDMIMSKFEDE